MNGHFYVRNALRVKCQQSKLLTCMYLHLLTFITSVTSHINLLSSAFVLAPPVNLDNKKRQNFEKSC